MNHVDDLLWDWLLGALAEDETARVDAHLAECAQCRALLDADAALIADPRLDSVALPPSGRLLAAATTLARFEHFADDVARLMDVTEAVARGWLSRIDDAASWSSAAIPDVGLFHIEGGPAVRNAVTGFVRLAPGTTFPEHTHLGTERVLVVQGTLRDEAGEVHGPGTLVERPAGTTHIIGAEPGIPLVYLSVVHEGVEIAGVRFGPDSPEL